MPLGDVTQQNAFLDASFGASASSAMATTHDVALFTGNPFDDGVEITGPGYGRVTVANDSGWPAAADGSKTRTVTFPTPTDAWDDGLCWVLFDGTEITAWEFLDGALEVTGPGAGPEVDVNLYIPNDVNVGA